MPVSLDGVGATINGESVYVSYISPNQVSVLTPPDLAAGPVRVVLTSGGLTSPAFTEEAQTAGGPAPQLTVTGVGQQGAYAVTVSHGTGAEPTNGTVLVAGTLSAGGTLVSMSGTGWTCPAGGITCMRSDALAAGSSYPPITVNAGNGAQTPQLTVFVSGGGSPPESATAGPSGCSLTLSSTSANLPATGTSTVETCPNNSGQPNCGVSQEIPVTFTVTPCAACAWTAASSNPEFLQIASGASGSGVGAVGFAVLNNTHTLPQSYTITVASGPASASTL